jgi:hypothetical protein
VLKKRIDWPLTRYGHGKCALVSEQPRGWSRSTESLFQTMRTHHAPNSADRERVRNALARRLENTSSKAVLSFREDGWALLGRFAHPIIAAVSLGVAVALFVGTMYPVERSRESAPLSAAVSRVTPTSVARAGAEGSSVASVDESLGSSRAASPIVASNVGLGSDGEAGQLMQTMPPMAASSSSGQSSRSKLGMRERTERRSASHPGRTRPAVTPSAISTKGVQDTPAAAQSLAEVTPRAPLATEVQPNGARAALHQGVAPATSHGEPDGRAELALVQRMLSAWTEAELAHVLALSIEHERRWPNGTFAQEREGLRAMAECLSHIRNAGARAQTFLISFPRAPLAPRVREACSVQLKSLASGTRERDRH